MARRTYNKNNDVVELVETFHLVRAISTEAERYDATQTHG